MNDVHVILQAVDLLETLQGQKTKTYVVNVIGSEFFSHRNTTSASTNLVANGAGFGGGGVLPIHVFLHFETTHEGLRTEKGWKSVEI